MTYRLTKVDPFHDDEAAEDIHFLDRVCFGKTDAKLDLAGVWWLIYSQGGHPAAYGGMKPWTKNFGYVHRMGTSPHFRGNRLQRRLLRAMLRHAKAKDLAGLLTDTSYDNIASSNNMIEAGFKLFRPRVPWSFKDALYWQIKF